MIPRMIFVSPDFSEITEAINAGKWFNAENGELEILARLLARGKAEKREYPVLVDAKKAVHLCAASGDASKISSETMDHSLDLARVSFMGTDGMRGKVATEAAPENENCFTALLAHHAITPEIIALASHAFARMLLDGGILKSGDEVCAGNDGRDVAADWKLCASMKSGFAKSGLRVADLGVVPTPFVPLYAVSHGLRAGAMITASHNPSNQNGIKFFLDGKKILPEGTLGDYALSALMFALRADLRDAKETASSTKVDTAKENLAFITKSVPRDSLAWIKRQKIFLDTANGAYTELAAAWFASEGIPFVSVNEKPDGFNINRKCGVAEIEGTTKFEGKDASGACEIVRALFREYRENRTEAFGIVLDGDGDRGFILRFNASDECVYVLDGDICGFLVAGYLKKTRTRSGSRAVFTVESDLMAAATLEREANLATDIVDVGDKWICNYPASDMVVGMESSGHLIMPTEIATPNGTAEFRAGNGLVTALVTLCAIAAYGDSAKPFHRPYDPGFSATFYTYFIDKSRFAAGTPLWAEDRKILFEALSGIPALSFTERKMEDRNMLYVSIKKDGELAGAIFARNSGTEDKNAVYLKCREDLKESLLPIAETIRDLHRKALPDRNNPDFVCAEKILSLLEQNGTLSPDKLEKLLPGTATHAVLHALAKEKKIMHAENEWKLKRNFGRFNEKGQFSITDPRTPEAWLHYLIRPGQPGTDTFCSGVTGTCGGFDIKGTHENTIVDTRVHLNDADDLGRYVYIRDAESADVFSTTWQPTRCEEQEFTTTFGFSSAVFESKYRGIETRDEMFVPMEFDGWIREITIRNASPKERKLEAYPFIPVHMGDALLRLLAGDNDAFFGGAAFDRDLSGIVFRRNHGIPAGDNPEKINGMLGNVVLFHSSLNTANTEYETSIEEFYGDRFHDQRNPLSVERSRLSCNNIDNLRRTCGAFRHEITLAPGEEISFAVSLIAGKTSDYYGNGKSELRNLVASVADREKRLAMRDRVAEWWKTRLGRLRLATPVAEINRAFPWLQYQCEIVYILNRMKSRFHTGYEYGWGFRDILQDILYLLPYDSAEMSKILELVSTQIFSDGRVYHNFFISQPGNKSIEASDDPLWFAQAVISLCRETGDFSFLSKVTEYADGKEGMKSRSATIFDHCVACVDRVLADRSERGLPWLKDCDWNDDLNEKRIDGQPNRTMESVMVAQQLYAVLNDFACLAEKSGLGGGIQKRYRNEAEKTIEAIRKHSMDKDGYFKRALDATGNGKDLGSSENAEGSIFLEPQIFGVNCGVTPDATAETVLESVAENLDTEFGAMLCWPFFTGLSARTRVPEKTWNIEKEPPGMKENGGIFMHLNAWYVEALCRAGKGADAVALFFKTLPENLASDQDRYRVEPYVYPEYVRGKGQPYFGRGGHTWLTGTAPTMHRALTEHIFGIRAEYDGLRIDPCFDPAWKEISMVRRFRGATLSISISNPSGVEKGVASITVDGKKIGGTVVPPFTDNGTHEVKVVMGS